MIDKSQRMNAARACGRGRGRGGGRGGYTSTHHKGEWWRGLDGDDVISLEPLCDLNYDPFALPSQLPEAGGQAIKGESVDAYKYFDGKILSRYLISSGTAPAI